MYRYEYSDRGIVSTPKQYKIVVYPSRIKPYDGMDLHGSMPFCVKLNAILATYRDEDTNGLDGIIAPVSGKRPRFIGLTTGRYNKSVDIIDARDDFNAVESSFCMVMPETVRKP